ncbi:Uncharacterised protein [Mycoplasmopsis citelli]|uniref:Uncharacterized protein n=1 Tax=Mycoplasmopsis citelli TaxID=171281 RepID=A0A449B120_9BACT|nr:hypothetical protein [Mycoplasmopsis citelli]VEU74276.1 Uncharacterised protein [Mycoplasmopsis citelli]
MKKINKFLPLIVAPTTIFSIIGVSAIGNSENGVYETTFDEIISRQNKENTSFDKWSLSNHFYDERNNINWKTIAKNLFVGTDFIFKGEKHNKTNIFKPSNYTKYYWDPFDAWYPYGTYEESRNNILIANNLAENMDALDFLNELKKSEIKLNLAVQDYNGNLRSQNIKQIYLNYDFKELENKINKLKEQKRKDFNFTNTNKVLIDYFKLSYNVDFIHEDYYRNQWTIGKPIGQGNIFIKNFWFNIDIGLKIKSTYKDNLKNYDVLKLKEEWDKSNLKTINSLDVPTDVGANYGATNYKLSSDDKSNKEYLEEELNKFAFYKNTNQRLNGAFQIEYELLSDNQTLQLYVIYYNLLFLKKEKIVLKKIKLNFQNTSKFKQKDIASRLRIVPNQFLDLTNIYSRQLVPDQPIRVENDQAISDTYGGTWIYHAPAKITFQTTEREDEELYINGNKVDVLDKNFEYDLNDLRGAKKQKDEDQEKTNQYTIEVVKYDKANANGNNQREIKRYKVVLIINSLGADLQGKWYAWNPEINPEQRELIEPYLKNERGEAILDSRGNKLKNPKYDPLINPKTGTKEEILWVDYTGNNKLPDNTRFLQDPLNSNGDFLNNNRMFGFIASGAVVNKGINITSNIKIDEAQRFRINPYNKSTFTTTGQANVNIINNDKDYFSSSGMWLYTLRDKGNIDTYKLFYINNDNQPYAKFSDVYQNAQVKPFWSTYHGKHLQKFLIDKKLASEDSVKKLSYEQVINYWKLYINSTYRQVIGNERNNPTLNNIKNTLEAGPFVDHFFKDKDSNYTIPINKDKIKEYAKTHTFKEFEKLTPEEKKNMFLNDNPFFKESLDKIDFIVNKNEIKPIIDYKNTGSEHVWNYENGEDTTFVKWKEDVDFESKTNKVAITPKILKGYLNSLFENVASYEEALNDIEDDLLLDFKNKDKVKYNIEKTFDNKLRFTFRVKEEFYKDYYIPRDQSVLYYQNEKIDPNYKSDLINVFANFNLKEINLNGIASVKEAKDFIKEQVVKAMDKRFSIDKDYLINNLDSVANQATANLSILKEPVYFNLNLSANTDKVNQLIGFKTIKIFNSVANNKIPRERDLINYAVNNQSFSSINTLEEITQKIIENLNNDLRVYGINFNDYLTFENSQDILKLITPKKINKINLKIIPLNKLLNGAKTIEVINDNTNINSSPDVDENGKPIIKEIDYKKLAEEKLKQDQEYINSRNFPEEAEDFKNNQIKNEWEIGYVKPKGVEEIFKNLPGLNGGSISIENTNENQTFIQKHPTWFIVIMILTGIIVILLLIAIYQRYIRPPMK